MTAAAISSLPAYFLLIEAEGDERIYTLKMGLTCSALRVLDVEHRTVLLPCSMGRVDLRKERGIALTLLRGVAEGSDRH